MDFTSLAYLGFFTLFFSVYWFLSKRLKLQNIVLLVGSYVFYGIVNWKFLFLLIGVSMLTFYLGKGIANAKSDKLRRLLLTLGIVEGVGALAFFKYYNFFIDSMNQFLGALHITSDFNTLKIILPLGISYFTFKAISYLLDVDKGKIEVCTNEIAFLNYMAFFPTIMAGPIDLGRNFIPQLETRRAFNYASTTDGLRQILWGFFKKVVIANNLALITNPIFEQHSSYSSGSLIIGAVFYSLQLYTDFSGYSDMAIGFGRLLGFKVIRNFDFPFFAQNIAEFWRKWHISLTAWLTEYIFTPLSISFRNWSNAGLILAIVINFTICGLWHGANWTYVVFGFIHGLLFIPLILKGTMNKRKKEDKTRLLPTLRQFINMSVNFVVVTFTFIIFRSENLKQALLYIKEIFVNQSGKLSEFEKFTAGGNSFVQIFLLLLLLLLEWFGRGKLYAIENIFAKQPRFIRWLFYAFIIFLIGMFSPTIESPFVYLKF